MSNFVMVDLFYKNRWLLKNSETVLVTNRVVICWSNALMMEIGHWFVDVINENARRGNTDKVEKSALTEYINTLAIVRLYVTSQLS